MTNVNTTVQAGSVQLVANALNVSADLPRKLRERDTTLAGVLVSNVDKQPHTVTVVVSSDILVPQAPSHSVTLAPGQSGEVAFVLSAPKAGEGHVVFTITSDVVNEVLTQPFTVERPTTTKSVATLGQVRGHASWSCSVMT